MSKRKRTEETQEIKNVYKISNKKPLSKTRKRHIPAQNVAYKTGDIKRKGHSINRKKRKRIIRVSLFAFFLVAIFFSAVLLISQVFCKIDSIEVIYTNKAVNSKRYYTNEEIELNSSIEKGDNLLFLSSADVSRKIEKNLPYISTAIVKKDFPTGVIIELTECKKVYSFNGFLADEDGKFIEKAEGKDNIEIKCKNVDVTAIGEKIRIGDDTDKILDYLELVEKSGMNITKADFTKMSDIYMTYDGRIEIHIGKMSDEVNGVTAWKKLQLAKKSLEAEDEQNPNQKGTLNMTISKKAYFKADSENTNS